MALDGHHFHNNREKHTAMIDDGMNGGAHGVGHGGGGGVQLHCFESNRRNRNVKNIMELLSTVNKILSWPGY